MAETVEIFKAYNGTGYFCLLFIAALLYLWFTEEDKNLRLLFVVVPTVLQVLFFVPYFYMAYNMLDEGTYYRILWLLPMTAVIAYSAVKVIGTNLRLGVALMCLILILSGTYAYSGMVFTKAENAYHIPNEVISLCDMVAPKDKDERIFVAFPPKLVHYVRQYTTNIMLPFGRDSMVDSWKKADNALYDMYASGHLPAEELAKCATDYLCDYVIVSEDETIEGDPVKYGLVRCGAVGEYTVYENKSSHIWHDPGPDGFYSAMFAE